MDLQGMFFHKHGESSGTKPFSSSFWEKMLELQGKK